MRILVRLTVVLVLAGVMSGGTLADVTVRLYHSDDTLLILGSHTFEGGKTLNLRVGIGSGAFHHRSDPPNILWTIGDRGPNFTCGEAMAITGVTPEACSALTNGRIYLTPSYTPSIYRVMLMDD